MDNAERIIANSIAFHGGSAMWQRLVAIEATLDVDGFLFTTKRIKPLRQQRVAASTTEARFTFFDWPRPGLRGEWLGDECVRIVSDAGAVVAERHRPRQAFRGLRRELWWDDLDFLYFAGYATWNYLTTPFLFLRPGFTFAELPPADGNRRVLARFPQGIPTHCREQVFHFAPDGELLRLDYTAEVVGRWAHAAHLCSGYRDFDGIRAPTLRRVRPLFNLRKPLPFPTLVAVDVHELRPVHLDGS
jgi:hypothetical protein